MAYQQPAYQQTVNPPVVVQPVQPVVIPVVSGLTGIHRNQGINVGKFTVPGPCVIFMGFFGFGFIVMSLFMLSFDYAFDHGEDFWRNFDRSHSPIRYPMLILLSVGVILSAITVGLCLIAKRNKRIQESHDNTQPISEPFTQAQMNQGSPMYVPVQSGPGLSHPNNATSAPVGFDAGAPQNFGQEKAPFAEYDQPPPFAPPAYSP